MCNTCKQQTKELLRIKKKYVNVLSTIHYYSNEANKKIYKLSVKSINKKQLKDS